MTAKKQTEPKRLVGFSVRCSNADEYAIHDGLRAIDGCLRVGARSLGCRANGYDGWELTAFFAHTPDLAAQDGAVIYINGR